MLLNKSYFLPCMKPRIGLVGVPIETVPIQDTGANICVHIPKITDKTRELIIKKAEEQSLFVQDMGELILGEYYNPGFRIDRREGIPAMFYGDLMLRDMNRLEQARLSVLEKASHYDLLVATGPSHLGAITLYAEGSSVVRMDYHTDFSDFDPKLIYFAYSNYMSWVKANIKKLGLINYFVKPDPNETIFGKIGDISQGFPSFADYFDIDIDCFNIAYQMQNIYPHYNGPSEATPDLVLAMIEKAKPKKIGFWEYRPVMDVNSQCLDLIVNAMARAVRE
jgi:hypothetical protein